ncbi:MAG: tRNA-queuosine alpha-mannosyltransferase domain-containing protein [Candidatus Azotimanducaceae bacterium WSBS_2022_MAG_OTU7]
MMPMKKLLILSPYDGFSHGFWREGLVDYLTGKFDITQCTLPPRYFSWRQRGNSLAFAMKPELQQSFDLVVATSMTDLSALRGLNRNLSRVPGIVYFHENQFAYPESNTRGNTEGLVERQLTSIYTALSADRIFFNSEFNRSTFLAGAKQLLGRMPDEVPSGIVSSIEAKSSIVPVPLDIEPAKTYALPGKRLKIVWNHRWEHDKGPDRLNQIVTELVLRKVDFELSLYGQQFSRRPLVFDELLERLRVNGNVGEVGFVEHRREYLSKLSAHDFVLSTADQEFQGLAIQEAMACGCIPVVPDALSYPDYVPAEYRYNTVSEAVDILLAPQTAKSPSLDRYAWATVGPDWTAALQGLCP